MVFGTRPIQKIAVEAAGIIMFLSIYSLLLHFEGSVLVGGWKHGVVAGEGVVTVGESGAA